MNKDKLQQELKKKIKEGVKPSDLKKKPEGNISQPKNNIQTNEQLLTLPNNPADEKSEQSEQKVKDWQITELQKQVNFWSTTANTHLSNLQKATGQIINLEEEIKELKKIKPAKTQQELEQALQETNEKIRTLQTENNQWKEVINKSNTLISDKDQKIAQHEENIKKLQQNNQSLSKTIEGLQNQANNDKENQGQLFNPSEQLITKKLQEIVLAEDHNLGYLLKVLARLTEWKQGTPEQQKAYTKYQTQIKQSTQYLRTRIKQI